MIFIYDYIEAKPCTNTVNGRILGLSVTKFNPPMAKGGGGGGGLPPQQVFLIFLGKVKSILAK